MTRRERIGRYMEILEEFNEGNSSKSWEILDKLSDEELFDEDKILEKIHIIQNRRMRIEKSPNRYPENIMECVRQQKFGLNEYDVSRDQVINQLSPEEVFECVCNWNGLLEYAHTIKSWIRDVYKIDLNEMKSG